MARWRERQAEGEHGRGAVVAFGRRAGVIDGGDSRGLGSSNFVIPSTDAGSQVTSLNEILLNKFYSISQQRSNTIPKVSC